MPEQDEAALRHQLALANRVLAWAHMFDQSGHISVRLDGDEVLINPRPTSRRVVRPEQFVVIGLDGTLRRGELQEPSEVAIHTRIYLRRPEVRSVAHLHSRMVTNFGISDRPLVPCCTHGSIFGGPVPVYDVPDLVHSDAHGDELAATLGDGRAVVIRGHGSVVVGEDIMAAVVASVFLEENADRQWHAHQLGRVRAFTDEECRRVAAQCWGAKPRRKAWDHYVAAAAADGYLDDLPTGWPSSAAAR